MIRFDHTAVIGHAVVGRLTNNHIKLKHYDSF